MAVDGYLTPSEVLRMGLVCKDMRASLADANDAIWRCFLTRYGARMADTRHDAFSHPLVLLLRADNHFALDPRVESVPTDVLAAFAATYVARYVHFGDCIRSVYNDSYLCKVLGITLRHDAVEVHFHVTGDRTEGDLQHPRHATLHVDDHALKPVRMWLIDADPSSSYAGILRYETHVTQDSVLRFEYGWSGYSDATLCALTDDFCSAHALDHVVRARPGRPVV
ncbi:hypothetical protein SPRG_12982 [Saprolegnia parasitica CBS 223.65]|uniref:Uncharacterized protein n=1 Tax=Saprolegnia parasitica (strain CBS 223.65) TaxID=695850 RepID=A0A067BUW8_SAPPC|nr:hypothetical protein SPRG_12982 [Saprolegnia parasitica CBS 223.65]KDO20625.1 hypothetical protein SPRG_12982 [Saprolegnia parasitica CBS 223.65]|eukprot:XP_012208679.1 hypothetical protein SPRG_12982 [Saprolegnia parasitica CBS 223.65]